MNQYNFQLVKHILLLVLANKERFPTRKFKKNVKFSEYVASVGERGMLYAISFEPNFIFKGKKKLVQNIFPNSAIAYDW